MGERNTTDVGLDTCKNSIQVAMLLPGSERAVEWEIANEPRAVRRMAKRLKREAVGELRVCYEAGPCGYVLQRQFGEARVSCMVIAPSLIPVKPAGPDARAASPDEDAFAPRVGARGQGVD